MARVTLRGRYGGAGEEYDIVLLGTRAWHSPSKTADLMTPTSFEYSAGEREHRGDVAHSRTSLWITTRDILHLVRGYGQAI